MEFEWNSIKSAENKRKHGVSFSDAMEIWDHAHVEIQDLAYAEDGEKRSATMGWIGEKIYVAIWTPRNETIRIISVRRARENEEEIFTQKIQKFE